MLNKYKAKREEGFTIIEVLIVLAIAGLIMVIVFVAVPQLQRNQRNEARNNDARLITAAVSECLGNKNGNTSMCDSVAASGTVTLPDNLKEVTALATAPTKTAATLTFNTKCNDDGTTATGNSTRQFTVTYQVEGTSGDVTRCIQG